MKKIDKIFDDWDELEFEDSCDHFWVLQHTISGMKTGNSIWLMNNNINQMELVYKCLMCGKTKNNKK